MDMAAPACGRPRSRSISGSLIGVGGAFFRTWIGDGGTRGADAACVVLLGAALLAVPISVGLQGLDALDLPLAGLRQKAVWEAGLATSYGRTAIAAAFALFAGVFAFAAKSVRRRDARCRWRACSASGSRLR